VIDSEYIIPSKIPMVKEKWLRHLYLHEISHRLSSAGDGHNCRFFCLNLALNFRASNDLYNSDSWQKCGLYDLQDVDFESMPAAFELAFNLARRLASGDLTAEQMANTIKIELTDKGIENKKNEVKYLVREIDFLKNRRADIWIWSIGLTSMFWLFVKFVFG